MQPHNLDEARYALGWCSPDTDRETWVKIGMAAHAAGLSLDDFDSWSQGGGSYNKATVRSVWRSFAGGSGFTAATLFWYARQEGWKPAGDLKPLPVRKPTPKVDDAEQVVRKHRAAAARAASLYAEAGPVDSSNPYLKLKGVAAPEGVKQARNGALLVPMYCAKTGDLVNLQSIGVGEKLYQAGAQKQGAYFEIKGIGPRIFTEGLATGATVHEATGRPVVLVFDAGSLPLAVELLAEEGDEIAADNDNAHRHHDLLGKKIATYGVGHKKAAEAGLPFYLPPMAGLDFNDIGTEATREVFSRTPVSAVPVFDARHIIPAELPTPATDNKLAELLAGAVTSEDAAALALAVAYRLSVRVPARMSVIQVREFLESNLPAGMAHPFTLDSVADRIEWFQEQREIEALAAVKIPDDIKARHNYTRVRELPKIEPEKYTGVIIVRAPMASGKTQQIGRPFMQWAQAQEGTSRALAICHRVSLVDELANRLSLEHYQRIAAQDVGITRGLATCLPSITVPEHAHLIDNAGYIFIDEIAQVLRFLESDTHCRTGNGTSLDVYTKLVQIVKAAKCLIVADAGLDSRTVKFLEFARPGERFQIIEMTEPANNIKATYSTGGGATADVLGELLEELAAGGKVWLSIESKDRGEAIAELIKSYGYTCIAVTGESKGNREQAAFLSDIENKSRLYDAVIASPVISSGVSVEHKGAPYFTLGGFIGSGAKITPADGVQMLRRVRYLERYTLGFLPNNKIGSRSPDALLEAWQTAARIEGQAVAASHNDELIADIRTAEENSRADFAAGMLWILKDSKWKLTQNTNTGTAEALDASLKAIRERLTTEKTDALKNAPEIDDDTAARLERLTDKTADQLLLLEAHKIKALLNVPEITDEVLEFWDGGRCLRRIDRFNAARGIVPVFDDTKDTLSRRRYWKACARAYSYLFNGIDIASGEHWLTTDTANTVLDRLLAQRHLLAHLGVAPAKYATFNLDKYGNIKPMKRPAYPVREVAAVLERLGLKANSKQLKGNTSGVISISKKGLCVPKQKVIRERVYQVTAESLSVMQSWTARRDMVRRTEKAPKPQPAPEKAQESTQITRPPSIYRLIALPDASCSSGTGAVVSAAKG